VSGRGARRVTAGLADQVVIALANAANTVVGVALLSGARAGVMLLSLGLAYLVIGLNRAFCGEVLLALAARYEGAERDRLVRDGQTTALVLGVIAGLLMIAVWALWPHGGRYDLGDLVWVGAFAPVLLLHDTARYTYLADRAPGRALVIDLVFVGVQALAVTALVVADRVTAGALLAAWGLGALAGYAVFAVRTRHLPWLGDPRRWLAKTRFLSGWFTATAVIGQLQVQAVNFLVTGVLGQSRFTAFRLGQTTLLQPVQNFNQAMTSLLVPRSSQLAGAGDAAALKRQGRRLALAFAAAAVVMVVVGTLVATFVFERFDATRDAAVLVLPMLVQGGIYLTQAPFTAALRGMHRGRLLFGQYAVFTTASLTGLTIGAFSAGLQGAAWGLTSGAAVGFAATISLYVYALRGLGPTGSGSASGERASESVGA